MSKKKLTKLPPRVPTYKITRQDHLLADEGCLAENEFVFSQYQKVMEQSRLAEAQGLEKLRYYLAAITGKSDAEIAILKQQLAEHATVRAALEHENNCMKERLAESAQDLESKDRQVQLLQERVHDLEGQNEVAETRTKDLQRRNQKQAAQIEAHCSRERRVKRAACNANKANKALAITMQELALTSNIDGRDSLVSCASHLSDVTTMTKATDSSHPMEAVLVPLGNTRNAENTENIRPMGEANVAGRR